MGKTYLNFEKEMYVYMMSCGISFKIKVHVVFKDGECSFTVLKVLTEKASGGYTCLNVFDLSVFTVAFYDEIVRAIMEELEYE